MIAELFMTLMIAAFVAEGMRQFAEWEDGRRERRVFDHQICKAERELYIRTHGKLPPRQWPRWLTELWRGITAKADR
jgi:hypothetical protein